LEHFHPLSSQNRHTKYTSSNGTHPQLLPKKKKNKEENWFEALMLAKFTFTFEMLLV